MGDEERRPQDPEPEAEPDGAAEVGRLTGRAVNALGMRLLRLRPVRKAIRRGVEEADEALADGA